MEKSMEEKRSPIVAVLGHVDHGKTTLLDAIRNLGSRRKTSVTEREVGGITQRIGAYTVTTPAGSEITFIDTPGHEAFGGMRSRGAKAADIVILVVAANEGVKPQTRESITLIKEAEIPFIVAVTKIDLSNAEPERTKKELIENGVLLEGMGGDIPVVLLSAKTGQGIEDLLEVIALVWELQDVETSTSLEAVVIESHHDAKRGALATVVVKSGKIRVGDSVVAGISKGKIRAITDEAGRPKTELLPGYAGGILGFTTLPPVGSLVILGESKTETSFSKFAEVKDGKSLQIILKTDSAGSLEAIKGSLPEEVGILFGGIGEVSQSDVMLASSFNVPIVAFNVKVAKEIQDLAAEEKVNLHIFLLIYDLLEWVAKLVTGEAVEVKESILGKGEIVSEFPYGKGGKIAGVRVKEGRIARGDLLRITRDKELLGQTRISSLKQKNLSVDKVLENNECGILFSGKIDFRVGDVIESIK